MATSITYNSYNMNTTNVITSEVEDAPAPSRYLSTFKRMRRGGVTITDTQYYEKTIKVRGTLKSTGVDALEALIDTFHLNMSVQEKNLDIGYNASTRRYTATPASVVIDRPVRAANWAKFEVEFLVSDYGSDTSATPLLSSQTYTYTGQSRAITIGGNAPTQPLVIAITLTTVTPSSSNSISIKSGNTGEKLTITGTFIATDVITIDTGAMNVKVNGSIVDFSGAFPTFAPGGDTLIIESDFTTTTTYTANATWTSPANITSAIVELWGGGGAGAGQTANGGGGGGGGGAYSKKTVTVTPSTGYAVVVGAAATGGTGNGTNGNDSTFATTTVVAKGGVGGTSSGVGGAGGLAASSTGDIKYDGGAGGAGGAAGTAGGGGGEGAGQTGGGSNGGDALLTVAGVGGTGNATGGDGGAGKGSTEGVGTAGTAPGGGGGGAYRTAANQTGGNGARGEAKVTFSSYTFTVTTTQIRKYL